MLKSLQYAHDAIKLAIQPMKKTNVCCRRTCVMVKKYHRDAATALESMTLAHAQPPKISSSAVTATKMIITHLTTAVPHTNGNYRNTILNARNFASPTSPPKNYGSNPSHQSIHQPTPSYSLFHHHKLTIDDPNVNSPCKTDLQADLTPYPWTTSGYSHNAVTNNPR